MKTRVIDLVRAAACKAAPVLAVLFAPAAASADVVVENLRFRLEIGDDAIVKSLRYKTTGEELLDLRDPTPFCTVTQDRPYNNEIKLAYPNVRTVYPANRIRRDGDRLVVGFEIAPYEAALAVRVTDDYVEFRLDDFILNKDSYPLFVATGRPLDFTAPPVEEFRLIQLPVRERRNVGEWLNVQWDDAASVGVFATSPHAQVGADRRNGYRLMRADALRSVKLRGTSAVLSVAGGGDSILGCVDALERDFGLPRGVESRRNPLINASIYFPRDVRPDTIDRHIEMAKKGGFRLMLISSYHFFAIGDGISYGAGYPNKETDVARLLSKIREAGIVPGLHILHTHINKKSPLVRGGADRRLLMREVYTLARPLGPADDTVYVDENPQNAERSENCRILKFGRELLGYEGFTTEPPYMFTGVKRGILETPASAHEEGTIGGTLWVSEYGGSTIYLKQDCDLLDKIAEDVGKFWKAGMGFIYFDGSEGVPQPSGYHVPNAQYRVWRRLDPRPIFGEGAAKSHFSWHMLSGANAFDVFSPEEFKAKIDEFPAAEAPLMKRDFTRVNFGWWGFWAPGSKRRGVDMKMGAQPDIWEYGTSTAAAWDCPVSVQMSLKELSAHARTPDILEVMRRWEDVRARGLLTPEMKESLRVPGREHHLYLGDDGRYTLHEIEMLPVPAEAPAVRAFSFVRDGRLTVAYWHISGSGGFSVDLGEGVRRLEAAGVRYVETGLPREELRKAWSAARSDG